MYFERARDNVLPTIRDKQPSLVIFDLNSARLEPMAAIAAMKADPTLRAIRTLGYVSHVDSNAIEAAREAGIDQVLARSAFSDRLGEILSHSKTRLGTEP
jgi:DNA-binding NarL/FixJ family response regulator